MGIDRTWQSFAVKIYQRDTFLSCTLTFPVRNLSRNLPRVYWKISKNIRDAVGLGCSKEKRLETLWGKKKRNEVTKGRGIHNHRKSDRGSQWSWFWCTEFNEKFIWGVRIYSFYEMNCFSRILVGIYFLLVGWIVRFYPIFTEFLENCKKLGQRLMTS